MKYGDVTFGQMEAIINKLGGMDGVKGLLSGAMIVVMAVADKLLEFVGTVTVLASKKFVIADHFKVDTSANAEVRIGWISDAFKSWFLGRAEKPIGATELCCQRLREWSVDQPILDELGDNAETTLSVVWELLKLQPNGERGLLRNNGHANIFYVRDTDNILGAVCVNWDAYGYWNVGVHWVNRPRGWHAGSHVFFFSRKL